jgi:hypothetical protein
MIGRIAAAERAGLPGIEDRSPDDHPDFPFRAFPAILWLKVQRNRSMPFLSRLFGKFSSTAADPILHKSCRIFPDPVRESGGWRVAARVEKDVGGDIKVHQLGRADTFPDRADAVATAIDKAKLAIDQLGDELFR